uniref:Protein HEG-like isoform X1 n=1 Tax=Petromyzon marinus TaxID=7757 RepID=A0AAJ7TRC1_PETMA|nr:protein HEG-like isoform X1 [Petromyzon marinus]
MPLLSRSVLLCSLLACVAHTVTARGGHAVTAAEATATTAAVRGQTEAIASAVAPVQGRIGATAEAAVATAEAPQGLTDATLATAGVEATAAATAQGHTEATSVFTTVNILSSPIGPGAAQQITRKIAPSSQQREASTPTTFTTGATITEVTVLGESQTSEASGARRRSKPADVSQTDASGSSNGASTLASDPGDLAGAASSATGSAGSPLLPRSTPREISIGTPTSATDLSAPPPLTESNATVFTAATHSAPALPRSPAASAHDPERARLSASYSPTEIVDTVRGRTIAFGRDPTRHSKGEQSPDVTIATLPRVAQPPTASGGTEATSSGALLVLQKITRTPVGSGGDRFTVTPAVITSEANLEKTAIPVITTALYASHSHSYNKTAMITEMTETTSTAPNEKELFVTHGPLGLPTGTTSTQQSGKDVDSTSVAKSTAAVDTWWQQNVSVDARDHHTSTQPQTHKETDRVSHGNISATLTTSSNHEKFTQSTTDNPSLIWRVTNEVRETASANWSRSTAASTPLATTTEADVRDEDRATSVPPFHRGTAGSTWGYLSRTAATESTAKSVNPSQAASTLAATHEPSPGQVFPSSASTQIIVTNTTSSYATRTAPTIGTMKDPQTTLGDGATSMATSAQHVGSESSKSSGSSETTALTNSTIAATRAPPTNNETAPPTHLSIATSPGPCSQHNCKNGGTCRKNNGSVTCQCEDGWSGIDCSEDVDECTKNPCPLPSAACSNAPGSFACKCPPGYDDSTGGGCVQVKVFPGIMRTRRPLFERGFNNGTTFPNKRTLLQLVRVLNESFKDLHHFVKSVINITRADGATVRVSNLFGAYSAATSEGVAARINGFVNACRGGASASPVCSFAVRHGLSYEAVSLCDGDACDAKTSECADSGGFVRCTCKTGYFKFKDTDRTCRDCGSGYFLRNNGSCTRCSYGFGGFNCDDPSLLVMVAMAVTLCCLFLAMVWMAKKACGRRRARARRLVPSRVQLSPYADLPPAPPRAHRARARCDSVGSRVKLALQQQISSTSSERASEVWRYSDMEMHRMSKLGRYNLSYVGDEAGIRDYF